MIRCSKNYSDTDVVASFNLSLLHCLLEALPSISMATSAGALKWYFTLLNRVKCMDVGLTGQVCADMMAQVAKEYNAKQQPWHAVLKAR